MGNCEQLVLNQVPFRLAYGALVCLTDAPVQDKELP